MTIIFCQDILSTNNIMITITFIQTDGVKKSVSVNEDEKISLLEVAKQNNIEIMGACDGACACGTCHIKIDKEHLSKIEKPSENEENVLDIVFNVEDNSRLACQVFACKELDGAIITIC